MDAERRRELLVLWAVLLLPLAAAALIALSKWGTAVSVSNAIADWIGTRRERAGEKTGFFAELFLRPVLWCFYKLVVVTAAIESPFIKAGVRIATWTYLVGLILFLIYWVTVIVIAIAILVVVFWILGAILGQGGSSSQVSSAPSYVERDDDAIAQPGIRGQKIYSGTSWFNEELNGRVDEEGNLYKGTNWFTEEKIGRIDDEGNIYGGTSWTNEVKVGRIDKDGTLYKGSNWFTEDKTGRIAEDGTILKGTNWFNEEKSGRIGD